MADPTDSARQDAVRRLRRAAARYRSGRFEAGENGGAAGMIFFHDPAGHEWFLGGLNRDAANIVTILNAVLEILEHPRK